MLSLQHDTGKWCTEYTYSGDDSMFGLRVLHNFGKHGHAQFGIDETRHRGRSPRIDEDEAMEGGLKGRISAGAELYFSAKEKSAGGGKSIFP
jgi:distribution and morphology protein 10